MDLIAGIDSDQYFASKANYLKVLKVSSYEELKSLLMRRDRNHIKIQCMKLLIFKNTVSRDNG